MDFGNELKLALYIEGRRVPVISAQCQFRKGAPSTAVVECVPLREINDIAPRTMVHLFVKDFTSSKQKKPWVLLFEGEVYGYSMGKGSNSRSFNLMCMDISNYWDNAKQFYMNQKTAFGDAASTIISNKAINDFKKENIKTVNTITGIKAYLVNLVSQVLENPKKDLLDAVIKIIKQVEQINPFYRYANTRYRINDRIVFQSSGDVGKLFDFTRSELFLEAIAGSGNGGLVSIREIVNKLMSLIFHEFVSIPAASKTGTISKGIGKTNQTIGSFLFKPSSFMIPPPNCNVLYPDLYENFSFNRTFFHEVTRLKMQTRHPVPNRLSDAISAFLPYVYAPSGFNEYRTTVKGEVEGKQYENAGVKGKYGDNADDLQTTTKLQDYNFMSFEEVIKGIFSDQDNVMSGAHTLASVAKMDKQNKFFQRAVDHLFFKKRFASRNASASGPLNLAPVPGFNILLVDDSASEQHIIGTLEAVSHTISNESGASTSYQIGFARYVEEKDLWEGSLSEPPIPPWYDPNVFGKRRPVEKQDYEKLKKEDQERVKDFNYINDFGNSGLKDYYLGLLGNTDANSHLGSEPITSKNFPNIVAATLNLVSQYRNAKDSDVFKFIRKQIRRDYVELSELFQFLGATIPEHQKNISTEDIEDTTFSGDIFDGGFVNNATNESQKDLELKELFGKEATAKRRAFLDGYRKRLFKERGFRG
jgi:hypothetical protein